MHHQNHFAQAQNQRAPVEGLLTEAVSPAADLGSKDSDPECDCDPDSEQPQVTGVRGRERLLNLQHVARGHARVDPADEPALATAAQLQREGGAALEAAA